MDIDDLLAEVAVESTPQESRDLQELTRCWVAERVAPEILPWPGRLMERVLARIGKQIDTHPLHIQSQHAASLDTPFPLLSPSEHQYLTSHQALLSSHYTSSFLSQFPASLQRLDDTTGGISMVDKPDEDKAVFVRALRDVGEIFVEGTDRRFEMKRGDVWVVRWSAVKAWQKRTGKK
ncbi:GINS complex, Sld5 component [Stemphylium lycopersici]|uniref:DNA replication complex GINS protein SLD5 n=1 Tax=Stemphylium lycopersici TaxID=183478 RepID=A0A364MW88_STELY|nr:GINS complex, Sld5 component [Stemphylium lycopersici]